MLIPASWARASLSSTVVFSVISFSACLWISSSTLSKPIISDLLTSDCSWSNASTRSCVELSNCSFSANLASFCLPRLARVFTSFSKVLSCSASNLVDPPNSSRTSPDLALLSTSLWATSFSLRISNLSFSCWSIFWSSSNLSRRSSTSVNRFFAIIISLIILIY